MVTDPRRPSGLYEVRWERCMNLDRTKSFNKEALANLAKVEYSELAPVKFSFKKKIRNTAQLQLCFQGTREISCQDVQMLLYPSCVSRYISSHVPSNDLSYLPLLHQGWHADNELYNSLDKSTTLPSSTKAVPVPSITHV